MDGIEDLELCPQCGKIFSLDEIHKCENFRSWIEVADSDEADYNLRMGRTGVRWVGD